MGFVGDIAGPRLHLYEGGCGLRLRSGVAVCAEHFEVVGGGLLDEGFGFREGIGGGYAPREIGQVCGIASGCLLNDGGVFQSVAPGCPYQLPTVAPYRPYGVPNLRQLLRSSKWTCALARGKGGRGDWTRTSDPLHPMQVRYQTAPHPDRRIRVA